jgi:hypothetical protein
MCDLLGRLIDITPRSKSPEKNYTPNYPIPSIFGLDSKFGEIKPNTITSIQIPRVDLEQYRSDISTSQIGREIIGYSSPVFPGLSLSQTIIKLPEFNNQSMGPGHILPIKI